MYPGQLDLVLTSLNLSIEDVLTLRKAVKALIFRSSNNSSCADSIFNCPGFYLTSVMTEYAVSTHQIPYGAAAIGSQCRLPAFCMCDVAADLPNREALKSWHLLCLAQPKLLVHFGKDYD